jgi:hypothetical protein
MEIIGGPGLAPGQFNNPWSIALDAAGNLYVADAGNHRVQKLYAVRGSSFVLSQSTAGARSSRTTSNEQRTTNN